MRLKIPLIIARWLFALCLPCLLLTASIWWAANSHGLYTSGFAKYDVAASTGLSKAGLDNVATGLIDYFNSGDEFVDIVVNKDSQLFKLFTEEEILHFRDVKGLLRLDFYVLLGTGIYAAGYAVLSLLWQKRRDWRGLAWAALTGSSITLAIMLVLGVWALLDFDQFWLRFHFLSFSNEFWSAEGYMLLLFPQGFWYDTVIYCAIATAAAAVILGMVAAGYLFFTRRVKSGQVDSPVNMDNGERTDNG
jgi:integral membrane protein (TIGR01906 family)